MSKQDLIVLSFNAGLLKYKLLGLSLFEPINFTKERFSALGNSLKKSNADLILLQEV